MGFLHDGVGADRAHGKEVENCEEDQHCLLKDTICQNWGSNKTNNVNPTTINKNASSARIDLCSRIFAGLDQEVDDVEDVEGSPREEEHNAHTNQDSERSHNWKMK